MQWNLKSSSKFAGNRFKFAQTKFLVLAILYEQLLVNPWGFNHGGSEQLQSGRPLEAIQNYVDCVYRVEGY